MNLLFLNIISNSIISVFVILFFVSIFVLTNHPIKEHKSRAQLAKVGLGITGSGSFALVLLALLNYIQTDIFFITLLFQQIGLVLNFCWLAWWFYYEYKKQKRLAFPSPTKPPMKVGPKVLNKKLSKKILP